MALADTARLIASLELQDKFTGPARRAEGAVGGLEKKVSTLGKVGQNASRGLGSLVGNLTKIAAFTIGASVAAAATGIAVAVNAASDLNEEIDKSAVVFGKASPKVIEFSENAATIGLSTAEALGAAGAFGTMFNTIGFGESKAADMSTTMVQLAADMASFNNEDPSEMLDKLRSGLSGEAEPLRRFGVLISEATVKEFAYREGIAKEGAVLTEAQKVQARYGVILEQTAIQQGNFADTSDSMANQQRELKANLSNTAATLGTAFLPTMKRVLDAINDLFVDKQPEIKRFSTLLRRGLGDAFSNQNIHTGITEVSKFIDKLADFDPSKLKFEIEGDKDGKIANIAGSIGSIAEQVKGLPWEAIGDAARLLGTGSKALLDAFLDLPSWVQTAVLTGWGLNKLTGGALTGIAGELSKGLIKGILGINAGTVIVKGGIVQGPGGGGVAPTPAGGGGKVSSFVSGAIATAGIAATIEGGFSTITKGLEGDAQDREDALLTLAGGFPALIGQAVVDAFGLTQPKPSSDKPQPVEDKPAIESLDSLDDQIDDVNTKLEAANKSHVLNRQAVVAALTTQKSELQRQRAEIIRNRTAVLADTRETSSRLKTGFTDNGAKIARMHADTSGHLSRVRAEEAAANAKLEIIKNKKTSFSLTTVIDNNVSVEFSASAAAIQLRRVTQSGGNFQDFEVLTEPMTLQLLVNGEDFTAAWRVYESRWSMRAWRGESVQSEFLIDDVAGSFVHADFAARKIVEVWEDASGSPKCMYRGRIANKTLGPGNFHAPGHAMRWTLLCEDFNIDLQGIRVINADRPEESNYDRAEVIRQAYLNGAASTHPQARDSTDLDGGMYLGPTPGDAVTLDAAEYIDTDPLGVLTQMTEQDGHLFFVYLQNDGVGALAYMKIPDEAILSNITIVDDAEDEGADGQDVYAAYWQDAAGDHAGQNVLTGAGIRYGDGSYAEESDVSGYEAIYDKWETTFSNDMIYYEVTAEAYVNTTVAANDEGNTYFASIDVKPENVHRIKAGMMVPLIRKRANKLGNATARAVVVTYEPVKPNADGESWYRVILELGRPRFLRTIPPKRRRIPRPPTQPSADACARLYFSIAAGAIAPSYSAVWNTASPTGSYDNQQLKSTADGTYAGTGSGSTASAGGSGNDILLGQFVKAINSSEAAILEAGGTLRMQARSRSRYGTGISEAAQDNISQIVVRVFDSGGSLRGIAYDGQALGSSAGSVKWAAQAAHRNSTYPPAATGDTLAPVSGTVAGDYLVVEVGYRSFTVGTTGAAVQFTNAAASDLPEDDLTTSNLNAWIEICSGGVAGDTPEPIGGAGSGAPGTSTKYAPIDHVHPHGLLDPDDVHMHSDDQVHQTVRNSTSDPTVTDDADAGFVRGWHWNNTTSGDVFFLRDATAGAADWLLIAPETGGSGAPSTVDYLVGTADAGLSAEIVVGTTPGGELGGTWASPTVDAVHVDASHYQLNKLNGTTAPTVNDDSGDGYAVGSRWIDTTNDRAYTCVDATAGAAVWLQGFSEAGDVADISGGTETTTGGYHYCAFTSGGTLTVSTAGHVEALVVGGGGGGGGYFSGGGGGAGGVLYVESLFLQAGSYTITVGAGGAAATGTTSGATIGNKSGRAGLVSKLGSVLFAAGGGGGKGDGFVGIDLENMAGVGASGGGAGARQAAVGSIAIGAGFAGGASRTGNTAGTGAGGGGGGSTAVGVDAGASDTGGAGGAGTTVAAFSSFGASGVFAGGGGGGGVTAGGNGGTGGGGHGGGTSANTGQTAATANTGSGGGGGGNTGTTGATGSAGGSGVVLVRVPV